MTKSSRSKNRVRIEENLVERLSDTARAALDAQLFAWPADPVPLEQIADVAARGMATAREILRLYPWPHQCPEEVDGWPHQCPAGADG